MLTALFSKLTYMSTLQDRISELMLATGLSVGQLAEIAGVSSSAVSQWKDGPTKALKTGPATRLAERTGYHARWIADGDGPKKSSIAPALAPAPGPSHPPSLDQALEVVAAQLNALSPLVADAGRSALANLASGQATPQATAAVLEALASATAKLPIASSAIAETPVKVKKHET